MLTLKEWRRARGISQEEMAEKLEIHINTYRSWEETPSLIRFTKAVKMAEILKVELSDIIFTP